MFYETKKNKIETWIFKKIYESTGVEDPTHVVKQGGCIQQLCLHKFVARNIAAHELDISVLYLLLRTMSYMSTSEKSSLNTVSHCRSSICHAWSTNCFHSTELNILWVDLETHLMNLSDLRYRRIVQKHIQSTRKLDIRREEIAELSTHINNLKEANHYFK